MESQAHRRPPPRRGIGGQVRPCPGVEVRPRLHAGKAAAAQPRAGWAQLTQTRARASGPVTARGHPPPTPNPGDARRPHRPRPWRAGRPSGSTISGRVSRTLGLRCFIRTLGLSNSSAGRPGRASLSSGSLDGSQARPRSSLKARPALNLNLNDLADTPLIGSPGSKVPSAGELALAASQRAHWPHYDASLLGDNTLATGNVHAKLLLVAAS